MTVRTSQQLPLHSLLAFILWKKIKMLFTGLGRSVLEETVPEVLSTGVEYSGGTQDQYGPPGR